MLIQPEVAIRYQWAHNIGDKIRTVDPTEWRGNPAEDRKWAPRVRD